MVEKAGKLSVSESLHQVPTGCPIIHIFLSATHMKTVGKNLLECQSSIVVFFFFLFIAFTLVFLTLKERK